MFERMPAHWGIIVLKVGQRFADIPAMIYRQHRGSGKK